MNAKFSCVDFADFLFSSSVVTLTTEGNTICCIKAESQRF